MRTVWRCGTNHFSTMSASRSRSSLLQSLGLCFALGACLCACGGGGGASTGGGGGSTATQYPQPPSGSASLTQSDVAMLVEAAAQTANSDAMSIAVVDRLGNILAVWQGPTAPPTSAGNYGTHGADWMIWRFRSRGRQHFSVTIRLRFPRALSAISAGFIFRRELQTLRTPLSTELKIQIAAACFRQITFLARKFRPLPRSMVLRTAWASSPGKPIRWIASRLQ